VSVLVYKCRYCEHKFEVEVDKDVSPLLVQVSQHTCSIISTATGKIVNEGIADLICVRRTEVTE